MTKVKEYQKQTIEYVKGKIHTLNLTILLGIIIVLFLTLKFNNKFLDDVPQGSVLTLLLIMAVLSGVIYALSKITAVRAINAIESYSDKLNTLLSTSRNVHRIDYSDVLLENIIESAVGITNADGAVLMINNGNSILIKITKGVVDRQLEKLTFIQSDGIAEKVLKNGKTINIADAGKTEIYLSDMDRRIIKGSKSLLCVPLSSDDKCMGVLELIGIGNDFFNTEDEEMLKYFVEQSALAMKKNIFYEDLKNYEIHLTNILVEAIEKLTGKKGHLRRTVKYALLIGQGCRMSEKDLKILYRAAMLHDIGFLKIDMDEITSVEQYNAHAFLGFKLLEQITFYRDISYPVLYHHERYDGTGYPKGLSGEEIPLVSRIISIAEVCDVMMNRGTHESKARNTGDNVSRRDLRFEEVISELKKNAGTQFDPHLVDVFITHVSEDNLGIEGQVSDSPEVSDNGLDRKYNENNQALMQSRDQTVSAPELNI